MGIHLSGAGAATHGQKMFLEMLFGEAQCLGRRDFCGDLRGNSVRASGCVVGRLSCA